MLLACDYLPSGFLGLLCGVPEHDFDSASVLQNHLQIPSWTLGLSTWKLVDPIVTDPIAQDNNNNRNSIQIYHMGTKTLPNQLATI